MPAPGAGRERDPDRCVLLRVDEGVGNDRVPRQLWPPLRRPLARCRGCWVHHLCSPPRSTDSRFCISIFDVTGIAVGSTTTATARSPIPGTTAGFVAGTCTTSTSIPSSTWMVSFVFWAIPASTAGQPRRWTTPEGLGDQSSPREARNPCFHPCRDRFGRCAPFTTIVRLPVTGPRSSDRPCGNPPAVGLLRRRQGRTPSVPTRCRRRRPLGSGWSASSLRLPRSSDRPSGNPPAVRLLRRRQG